MVNRVGIYSLIKKLHLFAAFVTGMFLLMYFVSGFLIVRYDWFDHSQPEQISTREPLYLESKHEIKDIIRSLRKQTAVTGKLNDLDTLEDGNLVLNFIRPGLETKVEISFQLDSVKIMRINQNIFETITIFHRMHKYGNELGYNLFMFMMDLASVSLLVFALTGIYLWFKILRKKTWGIIFFVLGWLYTIWVIIILMK